MSFKGFLSKKGIEHTIVMEDGTEQVLTFNPISVRRLITLQDIIGAFSKAIMVLTSGNSFDDIKTTHSKEADGYQTTVSEPVDPAITAKKQQAKDAAIDNLLVVLFHEKNVEVVGQLLIDSLKNEPSVPQGTTAMELMENTEAGVLTQLLVGFGKANKKVLPGPLRARVSAAWNKVLARLEETAEEGSPEAPKDKPSLNDSEDSLPASETQPKSDEEAEETGPASSPATTAP